MFNFFESLFTSFVIKKLLRYIKVLYFRILKYRILGDNSEYSIIIRIPECCDILSLGLLVEGLGTRNLLIFMASLED